MLRKCHESRESPHLLLLLIAGKSDLGIFTGQSGLAHDCFPGTGKTGRRIVPYN